jgi:hypothetical protein
LVLRLRRTVDEVGLHGKLTTSQWVVLCAAMHTIECTQQAVEAFVANGNGEEKRPDRGRYLRTYVVLQAVAVQQDATKDQGESADDDPRDSGSSQFSELTSFWVETDGCGWLLEP